MKLKIILAYFMALLFLSGITLRTQAENSYPFDWKLYPLVFSDERYYIKEVMDERPAPERNVPPDQAFPSFTTLDLETNLESYLNEALPEAAGKLPVILRIKNLKFAQLGSDGMVNPSLTVGVEFWLEKEGTNGKIYETEIVSVKKQNLVPGIHEKHFADVLASCLTSFSAKFDESINKPIVGKENEVNIPIVNDPRITPSETINTQEIDVIMTSDSQLENDSEFLYEYASWAPSVGFGYGVISRENYGLELSLCYLQQTELTFGLDIFYVLSVGKYIYLSSGAGAYGHIDNDDTDDEEDAETYPLLWGNFFALQIHTENCFIGIGHHSLKGYMLEFGFKSKELKNP